MLGFNQNSGEEVGISSKLGDIFHVFPKLNLKKRNFIKGENNNLIK